MHLKLETWKVGAVVQHIIHNTYTRCLKVYISCKVTSADTEPELLELLVRP